MSMKIDWKNLSWTMIISIIVTGISGIILSWTNTLVAIPDIEKFQITITGNTPSYLLPLSVIIVIGLTCILVLTLIFYFLIGFLRKAKKQI
jgi:phosphotransferase system  glucose/maltose/N-acetylglucosamine-specific IIC component